MRGAALIGIVLFAGACGRPEDRLVLQGSVRGLNEGDPTGLPLTLYRDQGGTTTGCTEFTPYRTLRADKGGAIEVDFLREEITGRFGLNRCLRLEWTDGERTAALSWLARNRDTTLPALPTWFDRPGVTPALPTDHGGVLPQTQSIQVSSPQGAVFRQIRTVAPLDAQLAGPGFEPAHELDRATRWLQRGQEPQPDAIDQQPLLEYEYRIEHVDPGFSGNHGGWVELAHGATCAPFVQSGGTACPLTDGDFTPVVFPDRTFNVDLQLSSAVSPELVVVRGIWTEKPFATLIVEGHDASSTTWSSGGLLDIDPGVLLQATSSLEDERPELFLIVPWQTTVKPTAVRVRIEDANHLPVVIGWIAEISIY